MRSEMTEEKYFQADEFASAFNLHCDLDALEAQRDRLAAAAERSTGLERESNLRQMTEVEKAVEVARAALAALSSPTINEPGARPEGRQRQQEDAIVCELRKMGLDPKALPPRQPGKSGAKTAVRARLPKMSEYVFKKAWDRLRKFGDIVGGD